MWDGGLSPGLFDAEGGFASPKPVEVYIHAVSAGFNVAVLPDMFIKHILEREELPVPVIIFFAFHIVAVALFKLHCSVRPGNDIVETKDQVTVVFGFGSEFEVQAVFQGSLILLDISCGQGFQV